MLQSVYPRMMYSPAYYANDYHTYQNSPMYFDPMMVEPSQVIPPCFNGNAPWMVPVTIPSTVPSATVPTVQETPAPVYSRPNVKIRMKANASNVTVATLYSHKIFVGSLGGNICPRDLVKLFGKFGTVIEAKVVVKDGHSKGYGFVSFPSAEPVKKILSSPTIYMDGKRIVVASAIRKQRID